MKERAKIFAKAAHAGQLYGGLPYLAHLEAVAAVAAEFEAPETVEIAAYLHDTLEDTAVTFEELEQEFGPEVARLVEAVTDKHGANRAERHQATYPALRAAGPDAVLLKLCDRLANVRASAIGAPAKLAVYREEFPEFRSVLYAPGEHEALFAELENLLN